MRDGRTRQYIVAGQTLSLSAVLQALQGGECYSLDVFIRVVEVRFYVGQGRVIKRRGDKIRE